MRGVYEANYRITSLNSARTLMYITAPSSKVVEIESAFVGTETLTTNEQLTCCFTSVSSLGTPTATTVTPSKCEAGDQAAGSTVKANVTASEPTYNSNADYGKESAPYIGGWRFEPIPEERPIIAPSATWGLQMTTTPTSNTTVVRIRFREIG